VLPDLPTATGFALPWAISAAGDVVVGHTDLADSTRVPWVWTPLGGTVQLADGMGTLLQGEARGN